MLFVCMFTCSVFGQSASLRKAVAHYRTSQGATATAVRSDHKAAMKKATTYRGTLKMSKPDDVTISVNGGKDQLIMNGNTFTMVVKGKRHVTDSRKNTQFASFQQVLEYILTGGTRGNLSSLNDLKETDGSSAITLTITPKSTKRRSRFSSFVLVVDKHTGALKSLRINQRGKNYTEYTFSNFTFK